MELSSRSILLEVLCTLLPWSYWNFFDFFFSFVLKLLELTWWSRNIPEVVLSSHMFLELLQKFSELRWSFLDLKHFSELLNNIMEHPLCTTDFHRVPTTFLKFGILHRKALSFFDLCKTSLQFLHFFFPKILGISQDSSLKFRKFHGSFLNFSDVLGTSLKLINLAEGPALLRTFSWKWPEAHECVLMFSKLPRSCLSFAEFLCSLLKFSDRSSYLR